MNMAIPKKLALALAEIAPHLGLIETFAPETRTAVMVVRAAASGPKGRSAHDDDAALLKMARLSRSTGEIQPNILAKLVLKQAVTSSPSVAVHSPESAILRLAKKFTIQRDQLFDRLTNLDKVAADAARRGKQLAASQGPAPAVVTVPTPKGSPGLRAALYQVSETMTQKGDSPTRRSCDSVW
ncbi:MAG: hypothetical protein ACKVP7_03915 [Hyphomicrobiaceae bacterium]